MTGTVFSDSIIASLIETRPRNVESEFFGQNELSVNEYGVSS